MAESLMGACINKSAAQYQETEMMSDVFQTVLTDVNLRSDMFLRILSFSKSRIYEGHFRSNITVPVTSLCMIQFSKTIPHFVRLYIPYKMVKSETKNAR